MNVSKILGLFRLNFDGLVISYSKIYLEDNHFSSFLLEFGSYSDFFALPAMLAFFLSSIYFKKAASRL